MKNNNNNNNFNKKNNNNFYKKISFLSKAGIESDKQVNKQVEYILQQFFTLDFSNCVDKKNNLLTLDLDPSQPLKDDFLERICNKIRQSLGECGIGVSDFDFLSNDKDQNVSVCFKLDPASNASYIQKIKEITNNTLEHFLRGSVSYIITKNNYLEFKLDVKLGEKQTLNSSDMLLVEKFIKVRLSEQKLELKSDIDFLEDKKCKIKTIIFSLSSESYKNEKQKTLSC